MSRLFETDLPINDALPALRAALAKGHAVLTAPPGSGKTTIAPLALLDEPWLAGHRILMLEPRRIATRGAASRMAQLIGEQLGDTVGYQIRFERRISSTTRIEVVTEGILTRRLQHDPSLEDVGLVIFDEFHERSIHADLGLALCLDAASALRDDLRLLVMSATLDTEAIATLLAGAPVVTAGGRAHPVGVNYLEREPREPATETASAIRRALTEQTGDILAFLPGSAEIRYCQKRLEENLPGDCVVRPLYGDLPFDAQVSAIAPDPSGRRRIVLATDIAESSLTIEGVSTVVDSGLAREPRFDPNSGLSRLITSRVSKASAEQRAGRAGRLGPGACYRLWTASQQERLESRHTPEILNADLAPLALELALWGVSDPASLQWLDPPPVAGYETARTLLARLDAIDAAGRITATGRRMADLGTHPRLAHLLLQAAELGASDLGADIAALLSERDPLPATPGLPRPADIEQRLSILRNTNRNFGTADGKALKRIRDTAAQLRRRLNAKDSGDSAISTGTLLALAFPDRIAKARDPHSGRYLMSNGRGATLLPDDPLVGSPFLVIAHLDAAHADGRIFLAARIGLDEIRSRLEAHIRFEERVTFDDKTGGVSARELERLDALVLSERRLPRPSADAVARLLMEQIRRRGIGALPLDDATRELMDRVRCLREWQPTAGWPDWSAARLLDRLDDWLAPYLQDTSRMEDLKRLDFMVIFRSLLGWERQQQADRLAPTHLEVPSGNRRRLKYSPGEPPVLAVKLQELFGLADTPAVCDGAVPVVLHLLSPAGRPLQITQDLKSFWQNTYPEVKKEMKGRYPKHPWPDDPWNAPPTASVKRRR